MRQKNIILSMSAKKAIFKWIRTLLMIGLCYLTAYPFIWMIVSSFTEEAKIFSYPLRWIPEPISLKSYAVLIFANKYRMPHLLDLPFSAYYWNSIKVTLITLIGTFFSSTLAAYAYAKINFKGRNKLFFVMLMTIMLPPQVCMLPNFIVFRTLGLIDNHAALWIPIVLVDAFSIFLIRQYMLTIPMELSESAFVDGAGHFTIYSRIILPLSKPILATVMIFSFLGQWNNYEGPLIYIRSAKNYTLPFALAQMTLNIESVRYSELMAATVLTVVPVLIVFGVFQRYFVESISVTGIKG